LKVIAINGSPRKGWNTAVLLQNALDGATQAGAETKLIHLYELNFKGCISCFSCKLTDGKSYGTCALADDLSPVLKKIKEADALILGSPIYFGNVTGEMRSFLERLLFPYLVYDTTYSSLFPKKLQTAFIYTMNVDDARRIAMGYDYIINQNHSYLQKIFGTSESLLATDTCQFNDYTKYITTAFDAEHKKRRHQEIFPKDCKKSFELGKRLIH